MTRKRGDKKANPRLSSSRPRAAQQSLSRPITLLTDFGSGDYFVGAMKGAILSVNPRASIIDITHDIPPQDVSAGAFTLLAACRSFPEETIHVAVVDPGVGSERLPILACAGNQFFVGPDNGLFSYVVEQDPSYRVFQISNSKLFRQPVSSTFHGRDVFAPVAAALSVGLAPDTVGGEIKDIVMLEPLAPIELGDRQVKGRILQIDHFGNCITNFTIDTLPGDNWMLSINRRTITTFKRFFAEETPSREKLFAIWGSAGFLEIAAQDTSAAKILAAKRGQTVIASSKD